MKPSFFATPELWRNWLAAHHESEKELLVGFYKIGSGHASITWPESVDGALCFGWIDGVRRSLGVESYTIRFTPRKARSIWSAVNVARVADLTQQGLMQPAGLRAFAARQESRTGVYAFEQAEISFNSAQTKQFQANTAAWERFHSKAAWFRKRAIWRVISAKQAGTQERRLNDLIADLIAELMEESVRATKLQ